MTDFETMSLIDLRKMLINTIIEKNGRDYALGWLHSAFVYDTCRETDNDREHLIAQIQKAI